MFDFTNSGDTLELGNPPTKESVMSSNLDELTERIMKAVVQGTPDDNDITALINLAHKQSATLTQLAADNERLTKAIIEAGDHITKLEGQIDSLSTLATASHLVQYAEETTGSAVEVA